MFKAFVVVIAITIGAVVGVVIGTLIVMSYSFAVNNRHEAHSLNTYEDMGAR